MTKDEIIRLARGFTGLGTLKIRLTGGGPTVRKAFINIVTALNALPNFRKLDLAHIGTKLKLRPQSFSDSVLRPITIDVDSADDELTWPCGLYCYT